MKKILYVEDNLDNFRLVKAILENKGYKVFGAEDGLEAISRAEEIKPDLILMDIAIPGMDGFEVTTRLKATRDLSNIPVIAISAKVSKKNRDLALAVGCIDFIPKPIDPFSFPGKIEAILSGKGSLLQKKNVLDKEVFRELSKKMVSSLETKVNQLTEVNRRLKDSERKYRSLVENVNVGIWYFSRDEKTIFLNNKMKEILEFKGIAPISIKPFLTRDEYEKFKNHLKEWEKGRIDTFTLVLRTPKKKEKFLLVSGTFVQSEMYEEGGYLISFLDITERKKLERQILQMQKLDSMATLTAGVSHDFNNILSIIKANLDLILKKEKLSENLRTKLDNIYVAVNRGINITKNLLAFSRSGPANFVKVDLKKELLDFVEFFSNYKRGDIKVYYDFEDVPPILADKAQIGQILLNLATNAQDAMEEGGEIRFYLRKEFVENRDLLEQFNAKGGEYVLIVVEDTGSGISPEIMDKIFEPLFTTKEPGKGTGLGLSTVFGIVKRHGGMIDVKSKPGVGTSFYVYFPVIDKEKNSEEELSFNLKDGKFISLLLEDEPSIKDFLEESLSDLGIEVISCIKFDDFMKELERGVGFDLVFVDFSAVGDENLDRLRKKLMDFENVIFMSGYSVGEIKKKVGDSFEIKYFLKKPFGLDDIENILKKFFNEKGNSC